MQERLVQCQDLCHEYRRGGETVRVLDQLQLAISAGDFTAVMGPSGSGKSTLLHLLGGLERPTAGSIHIQGLDITRLPSRSLADWRASSVGFIFQFYNLLANLSALANVELPLLLTSLDGKNRNHRAKTALALVGLTDRLHHKPTELSGGQQQRVAIARAFVTDPQLLICDEPTGDLDRQAADDILGLLQMLNRDHGKTIVMVTHDPRAADAASSILHMDKGHLQQGAA